MQFVVAAGADQTTLDANQAIRARGGPCGQPARQVRVHALRG
jgi:hypothetical protein